MDAVDVMSVAFLAKLNDVFPSAFAKYKFDAKEAAAVAALATKENMLLITAKLTQEDIEENLDDWVEQSAALILALRKENRVQIIQEQFETLLKGAIEQKMDSKLDELLALQMRVPDSLLFDNLDFPHVFAKLIQYGDVNAKDEDSNPLICQAAKLLHEEAVLALLETNKCDLKAKDSEGKDAVTLINDEEDLKKVYKEFKLEKRFKDQQAEINELKALATALQAQVQGLEAKLQAK